MLDVDESVRTRYSDAAKAQEAALCCPVDYNRELLKIIPQEVIDRDYGCGDPSKFVAKGETVLDLGSGGGKICFIAAQVVGKEGKVIGVDMNDDMLALAQESLPVVAEKMGYNNIEFCKGKIEDMAIDRNKLHGYLVENPVSSEADLQNLESFKTDMRKNSPMIADDSVDVVVSNCVLNLVDSDKKRQLFQEIFRVLKKGGRAVISDIVSDEFVPQHMQNDSTLWSGCISGAFQERDFLAAFEEAGFYGINLVKTESEPWQTVEGIEFRSVTVVAYKGKEGECWDHNEAVVYKGPFSKVVDDDGHVFERGERIAVCRKTFGILTSEAYQDQFHPVLPLKEILEVDRKEFACTGGVMLRNPKVTKGADYKATIDSCDPGSSCC
jgi:arsenite methyltransferase